MILIQEDEVRAGMRPHLHPPWRGLPGTAAALCVKKSLILSDEEYVGIFSGFVVKPQSVILFLYWLLDLWSVQRFYCLLVGQPESVMFGVVRGSLSE